MSKLIQELLALNEEGNEITEGYKDYKPGPSLKTKNPTAADLIEMFSKINVDAKKSGEVVVKLTDEDYYGEQIANIFEVSNAKATKLAKAMADEVKKRVADGSLPSEYGSMMKANKAVIK